MMMERIMMMMMTIGYIYPDKRPGSYGKNECCGEKSRPGRGKIRGTQTHARRTKRREGGKNENKSKK